MKKIIGLSLDIEILERVDNSRGLISRSAYIQKIISEKLRGRRT